MMSKTIKNRIGRLEGYLPIDDDLSRLSDDQLRDELYEISKQIAADCTLEESRRAAAARRVAEIEAGSY